MRRMKKLGVLPVTLGLFVFAALVASPSYGANWIIKTYSGKKMVTLHVGEAIEITYKVFVGIVTDEDVECNSCQAPVVAGECVSVFDDEGGQLGCVCARRPFVPGFYKVTKKIGPYNECGYYTVQVTALLETSAGETCCDTWPIVVKVVCPPEETPEYEGCGIGFWKNHLGEWSQTGYDPDDLVGRVFRLPDNLVGELGPKTLLQALKFKGGPGVLGGARILLRHAVASLLNAAHPRVFYPATPERVILNVNNALSSLSRQRMLKLKDKLEGYNEEGCPLGGAD